MTPFKLTLSLHPFSIVRLTSYSGHASLMVGPVHRSRLVSTQKVDAKNDYCNDARLSEVGGSDGPSRPASDRARYYSHGTRHKRIPNPLTARNRLERRIGKRHRKNIRVPWHGAELFYLTDIASAHSQRSIPPNHAHLIRQYTCDR